MAHYVTLSLVATANLWIRMSLVLSQNLAKNKQVHRFVRTVLLLANWPWPLFSDFVVGSAWSLWTSTFFLLESVALTDQRKYKGYLILFSVN